MQAIVMRLFLGLLGVGGGVAATGVGPEAVGYAGGLAGLLVGLAIPESQKKWIKYVCWVLGSALTGANLFGLIPVQFVGASTAVAGFLISAPITPSLNKAANATAAIFLLATFSCAAAPDMLRIAVGVNNVATAALASAASEITEGARRDEVEALTVEPRTREAAVVRLAVARNKWQPSIDAYRKALAAELVFADAVVAAEAAGHGVSVGLAIDLLKTWTSLSEAAMLVGITVPQVPSGLRQLAQGSDVL